MSIKNCVSFLMYFSKHIVWTQCRKPLKTLSVILGSIHEFALICMFAILSFRCTLNSYFLSVIFLVMLISRKFSECLSSTDSADSSE